MNRHTIQSIALARSRSKRRAAMRRQAKRRREVAIYGCPVHAKPETPEAIERFVRAEMARHFARKG